MSLLNEEYESLFYEVIAILLSKELSNNSLSILDVKKLVCHPATQDLEKIESRVEFPKCIDGSILPE